MRTIDEILDVLNATLLILGTIITALGTIGLLRMPDVYTRAQSASKTNTLGLALVFFAVALHFRELDAVMQALAVVVFAFASIPIGAHMITRAAHRVGERPWPGDIHDELRDAEERGERERSERGGGGGS